MGNSMCPGSKLPTDGSPGSTTAKAVGPSSGARAALDSARKEVAKNKGVRFEDRYQQVRLLGRGAYAKVLQVARKGTSDCEAAKIIDINNASLDDIIKELAVARILSDHPSAVRMVEAFVQDDSYVIVMELCRGGELFERIIKKGHFSEREAARVLKTLLGFLQFSHSKGVVHCDLKPENILLSSAIESEAVIKVIDYGCSKFIAEGEKLTVPHGSPQYVAPEVLAPEVRYDKSADIWSLGVIAYILLVGYLPFGGKNQQEVKKRVIAGTYTMETEGWESVSDTAKEVVKSMLQYDPSKRPTAKQLLNHHWFDEVERRAAASKPLDGGDMVSRLREHVRQSRFKRLALVVLARRMDQEEPDVQKLKELFQAVDSDKDGRIDMDEFGTALKKLGKVGDKVDPTEIQALFNAADIDHTGSLRWGEFIAAMAGQDRVKRAPTQAARQLMEELDADGDGYITAADVCKAMPGGTLKQAHSILNAVDKNGDGQLDFDDIKELMKRGESLHIGLNE